MTPDELRVRCRDIRCVVTDVDGVLTDGGMYYAEGGEELKRFNIRDGAGVALLRAAGIIVGCMTGESTETVTRRMRKIGADFCHTGIRDKRACLGRHLEQHGLAASQVAYIGDEINDFCLLGHVGVFFAVRDACPEIRHRASFVLQTRGGEGALREVASIVLEAKDALETALDTYLQSAKEDTDAE